METNQTIYMVTEYASKGEIFGKCNESVQMPFFEENAIAFHVNRNVGNDPGSEDYCAELFAKYSRKQL